MAKAAGAPRGSIVLIDQQTDRLILRAVLGSDGTLPPGGRPTIFRRGEGLSGWAVVNRQAVIVPDLSSDARWVPMDTHERDFQSALVAPLQLGEDVLGALLLLHPAPDYFHEAQAEVGDGRGQSSGDSHQQRRVVSLHP